jgi:hypothetical protein
MSSPLLLFLLLQGSSTAPVVINEFAYDDTSTDTIEYVELYNRSGAAVDISGWVLDAADLIGANLVYTVPAATILPAGGFYVFGSALVPNVNQILLASNNWENDNESLTLRDSTSAIVDTLIYEANKGIFNAALAEGPGIFGNNLTTEAAPFARITPSRIVDGYDTDNNGRDFANLPATPGASNNLASALPYSDNFDAAIVGTEPAAWMGSFVNPRVIDPTVPDANNPNAIAASPQGGNALICWDPTGGGNAPMFLTAPTDRVDLECYVYLKSTNAAGAAAPGEYESWTIGVQGTGDSFGSFPDPAGFLQANGVAFGTTAGGAVCEPNTGVAWTFIVFRDALGTNTATLYLVDENDGGTDNTVLGSVSISPGVNDGWQRLRLRVNGSRIDGWFGGPLGTTEGTHFSGTAAQPGPGSVYLQYREFITTNATTRPLTLDAVTIRAAEAGVDYVTPAAACAGSGGCAPSIAWTGGDASLAASGPFSVDLSRALGPSTAVLVIGVTNTGLFPLDLGIVFPPATAPCYLLQDLPILVTLATVGGGACAGTTSVGFPSLAGATVGGTLYLQWGVLDVGSPIGFPIVMSDGLAVTIQP